MNSRKTQDTDDRFQAVFETAGESVRRALERTSKALRRSEEIREALKKARVARPDAWEAGRKAMAMMQFAAEESARALHEKDRFLAVACHELRQPLGAAQAALAVLEVSRTPAEAMRARAVLRRQLAHMARLVEDLLDTSRYALQSSELKKTKLDLRRIVESALETTSSSMTDGELTVNVALPSEPAWLDGDESRLLQVFTNLLANAVRYTPRCGSVKVAMRAEGDLIITEVADTGDGIDPEDLPQLFEPFARGHASSQAGFGIGLALVRNIVERHGGSVAATSEGAGRGSCFTVVLPALY